jgi:MYXO-CTERM domain-containing protein
MADAYNVVPGSCEPSAEPPPRSYWGCAVTGLLGLALLAVMLG